MAQVLIGSYLGHQQDRYHDLRSKPQTHRYTCRLYYILTNYNNPCSANFIIVTTINHNSGGHPENLVVKIVYDQRDKNDA